MAKIVQDNIVINVSKIARDSDPEVKLVPAEVLAEIEQLVSALIGDGLVVEILS